MNSKVPAHGLASRPGAQVRFLGIHPGHIFPALSLPGILYLSFFQWLYTFP